MRDESRTAADAPLPGGDFRLFVQKLGYQALISLGVLDNPVTGERTLNLEGAHSVRDDLRMLHEKTRGNLEADEEQHLEEVLKQLDKHFEAVEGQG